MKVTVIDTNCMVQFYQSFLLDLETEFTAAVEIAFERGVVGIDNEGHALHEYDETFRPKGASIGLRDWIYEEIRKSKIVEFDMDQSETKVLKSKFGLPKKDIKWISIALGSSGDVILTEDIDLFDPKKKKEKGAAREKAMNWRNGELSKFLKKKHCIYVCRCVHIGGLCGEID